MTTAEVHRAIDAIWRIESPRLIGNARERELLNRRAAACAGETHPPAPR